MKSKFLALEPLGARIEVVEAGKGRDLLFLHGAGGHLVDDPLLAALASKYRVVAPLLPGYGQSGGEDGLRDMLDVTLHCLDVLEKLELEKPVVVGHSMGGPHRPASYGSARSGAGAPRAPHPSAIGVAARRRATGCHGVGHQRLFFRSAWRSVLYALVRVKHVGVPLRRCHRALADGLRPE